MKLLMEVTIKYLKSLISVVLLLSISINTFADGSVYATSYSEPIVGPHSTGIHNAPSKAVGPPGGGSHSLGWGGSLVLHFDATSVSPSGDAKGDLFINEVEVPEDTIVEISIDKTNWIPVGSVGSHGGAVNIDGTPGSGPNPIYRFVRLTDAGQHLTGSPYGGADIDSVAVAPAPPDPDKGGGGCGETRSNPCNMANGNKYQSENDFSFPGLSFNRYYNSRLFYDSGLGIGWTSTFHKRIFNKGGNLTVLRASGYSEPWTDIGGNLTGDPDSDLSVTSNGNGYTLTRANGSIETYDDEGHLLSETTSHGLTTGYVYGTKDELLSVTGPYGHTLTFVYDRYERIETVTDDEGNVTTYEYIGSLLTKVIRADGSTRQYKYEDTNFFSHLTGIVDENGDRYSTWSYDSEGRAISGEHANIGGLTAQEKYTFSYDSDTQTTVTDAVGTIEVLTFAENLGVENLINQVFTHDGKGVSRTLDANNNVLSKTDAEGRTTIYTYNAHNQKSAMTKAAGTAEARTTTYEYVSADVDIVTKTIEPSVYSTGNKETATQYDANLNPVQITVTGYQPGGTALSRTSSYTYNANGQVITIDGPRTDVSDNTTFTYHDCTIGGKCGQIASVTNANSQTTTYDFYNDNGQLTQSTDANGLSTTYDYDSRGRVTWIGAHPPTGFGSIRWTSYVYDPVGQVTKVILPDGLTIENTYNAAHYLEAVEDNQGNRIEYRYDLSGNRIETRTQDNNGLLETSLNTAYDARNQIVEINAAGSITSLVKDAVGNTLSQTDPNANPATSQTYDALDRLQNYIDSLGGQTSYSYNDLDQLTQVTTPNGATTTYINDDLGNLLSESSPDRGATTYSHDAGGNVLSKTDARNVTANYSYDVLNRLTAIDYPGTVEDISFVYDTCQNGIGRLCQVTDESGITDYAYGGFGNIASQTKTELTETHITSYEYDNADRIKKITYPFGRTVDYTRNSVGRIYSVNASGVTNNLVYNRSYRADGRLDSQTYGNGLIETRSYDSQGRLTQQALGSLETVDYSYDANGNVLTLDKDNISNGLQTWGYDYDGLDRLIDDLQGDTNDNLDDYSYTYDGNGNRESENTIFYDYDTNSNRLNQTDGVGVTYDAMGNMLTHPSGKTFVYNEAGRLKEVKDGATVLASYLYNANGQRTRKVTPNGTAVYHYDLTGNLISEHTQGLPHSLDYVWIDGQPIAQITNAELETIDPTDVPAPLPGDVSTPPAPPVDPIVYTPPTAAQIAAAKKVLPIIYMLLLGEDDAVEPEPEPDPTPDPEPEPDDKVRFIHADHLNTPRLATDNGQTVVWEWEGKAFGDILANEDPDGDTNEVRINLRFAGQYFDQESGLHYNWNRYYDPQLGRYITSDPIGLRGGMNTYGYALQNPINIFDQNGLIPSCFDGLRKSLLQQDKRYEEDWIINIPSIAPRSGDIVGPNLDPFKPRKPPIGLSGGIDLWAVIVEWYYDQTFIDYKLYELFTRYCSETRVDECGDEFELKWQTDEKEQVDSYSIMINEHLDSRLHWLFPIVGI